MKHSTRARARVCMCMYSSPRAVDVATRGVLPWQVQACPSVCEAIEAFSRCVPAESGNDANPSDVRATNQVGPQFATSMRCGA